MRLRAALKEGEASKNELETEAATQQSPKGAATRAAGRHGHRAVRTPVRGEDVGAVRIINMSEQGRRQGVDEF